MSCSHCSGHYSVHHAAAFGLPGSGGGGCALLRVDCSLFHRAACAQWALIRDNTVFPVQNSCHICYLFISSANRSHIVLTWLLMKHFLKWHPSYESFCMNAWGMEVVSCECLCSHASSACRPRNYSGRPRWASSMPSALLPCVHIFLRCTTAVRYFSLFSKVCPFSYAWFSIVDYQLIILPRYRTSQSELRVACAHSCSLKIDKCFFLKYVLLSCIRTCADSITAHSFSLRFFFAWD